MAPKKVDKEQRKREIAAIAAEVFAERGIEATSISQIARAAGMGKGTLYEYFDTKMDLILAAAAGWVEAIEATVAPPARSTEDPLTRLRTLLEASTRAFLEDPRMIRLFLGIAQVVLRDPILRDRLDVARRVSAPVRNAIRDILVDGASQGVLRAEVAEDAERLAINLVAFVDGLGLHYVSNPEAFDLTAQVDLYLVSLVDGLRVSPGEERRS